MKALVLVSFGRLEVREVPDPEPAPGEVLVRTAFTGICGSDIHGFTGKNGRRVPGQVMGHETCGRVAALGPGVTVEVGSPVTYNPVVLPTADAASWRGREQQHPGKYVIGVAPERPAAFAELVAVPERNLLPLPAGMPTAHGALVEPLAVATHAVARLGAAPGPVLVVGGGPIGQSLVVALRGAGVGQVLLSEPSAARRDVAERLGAIALDPATGDLPDQVIAAVGEPVAAAVDAVGIPASLADCFAATALGGTICLVGMGTPTLDLSAFELSTKERTLVGSFTYSSDDFVRALRTLADAPEDGDVLIDRIVDLADAPAAFAALAAGDGTAGKVLVRLGD